MKNVLMIALGGAVGSVLRYLTSLNIYKISGVNFPYGILVVNILGCFLMGLLSTIIIDRLQLAPIWRALILVGFLGGYTTFSSFGFDTISLISKGSYFLAGLYVFLSVVLCLLATVGGLLIGRIL